MTGASIWLSVRADHTLAAYTTLDNCETAWTESVAANVTVTADLDAKQGDKSIKMVVGAAVAAGTILATGAIASTDLSLHASIHLWVKSSVNTLAGDLQLLLDNTALCASPKKTLNIPALVANTWTKVVIYFDNTYHQAETSLPAIISVGVKMVTDLGAFDLYVDEIRAGNYLIEKFAGDGGANPVLGIAYFNLHTNLTKSLTAATNDFDIQVFWTATSVLYTPILDDCEILAHASNED